MNAALFDDYIVFLDADTTRYGGAWHPNGVSHAPDLLRAFWRLLSGMKQPVALDIGASTGSLALLAAHLPTLTVHAFEPVAAVRETLERNLALNGLTERVFVYPQAVGAVPDVATFYVVEPDSMSALSMLGGTPHHTKWTQTVDVDVTTVDAFVAAHNISHVDLLKVDVEGGDLYVLQGALKTLTRDHPAVAVEYNWQNANQYGYRPERLSELLHDFGYSTCLFGEDLLTDTLCAKYEGHE